MKYKVAIIVRTKNRELFLKRAIDSILAQNFKSYIITIVNDGGNADSLDTLLEEYKLGEQLKVIHNDISLGMEACSNIGIKNSQSKYITLLDDDDTWDKNFLLETVSFLDLQKESSFIKGVVTRTLMIYEKLVTSSIIEKKRVIFTPDLKSVSINDLMVRNHFTNNSFLFCRSVLDDIGYYSEDLPVLGDWEFNLRFILKYDIFVIPKVYANYHVRIQTNDINSGNTITDKLYLHENYKSIIINRLIRADIRDSELSLSELYFAVNTHDKIYDLKINSFSYRCMIFVKKIIKWIKGNI